VQYIIYDILYILYDKIKKADDGCSYIVFQKNLVCWIVVRPIHVIDVTIFLYSQRSYSKIAEYGFMKSDIDA